MLLQRGAHIGDRHLTLELNFCVLCACGLLLAAGGGGL
jgi:hypothetical protein